MQDSVFEQLVKSGIGSRGEASGGGPGRRDAGSSYVLAIFKDQNQHPEAHSFSHDFLFIIPIFSAICDSFSGSCSPVLPWILKPWK